MLSEFYQKNKTQSAICNTVFRIQTVNSKVEQKSDSNSSFSSNDSMRETYLIQIISPAFQGFLCG